MWSFCCWYFHCYLEMFLNILSCKHFLFKVPACFHWSFVRLCLTWVCISGPFDAALTRRVRRVGPELCSTHECLFPHVELAQAQGSRGGRWWEGAGGYGGLIICWLCCLAMLSTQICMLMSWGRCTVFGSAVGRANQEGSRRVKTQVLQVRAEPMSARRWWWWQREPALCRCSCFLQPNSTRTNACFWINYNNSLHAIVSNSYFHHLHFLDSKCERNQCFVISKAELFRFPYVCVCLVFVFVVAWADSEERACGWTLQIEG